MRAILWLIVALPLTGCSVGATRSESAQPSASSTQRQIALSALRAGLLATVDALNHDGIPLENRAIVEWTDTQANDQPGTLALSTRELNRLLASELGLTIRTGKQTTCEQAPHPTNMHPCRLNFQGVIYRPSILTLSGDSARVAVFFFAWPNTSGTRVMDMVRASSGWRIVNVMNITS